jgi:hypothetical protein
MVSELLAYSVVKNILEANGYSLQVRTDLSRHGDALPVNYAGAVYRYGLQATFASADGEIQFAITTYNPANKFSKHPAEPLLSISVPKGAASDEDRLREAEAAAQDTSTGNLAIPTIRAPADTGQANEKSAETQPSPGKNFPYANLTENQLAVAVVDLLKSALPLARSSKLAMPDQYRPKEAIRP